MLRVALIGSRELEKNIKYFDQIDVCWKVCLACAKQGYVFTSGLCELGMDGIAQKAYSRAMECGWVSEQHFEVYVADQKNIDRSNLPNKHLAIIRNPDLIKESEEIAKSVMGEDHWSRCGYWARGMHSRNCHQILGYDLKSPVDCVICWTPEGKIQGGTATAIKLAMKYDIPVFNLGLPDKDKVVQSLVSFLKDSGAYEIKG